MAKIEWDYIIDTIKRRKCVLFIGPQIYQTTSGKSLEEALCDFLQATLEDHPYIKCYYKEDGFFLFRKEQFRSKVIFKIRQFYEQHFHETETLLRKVAKIPFNIVINLNPDNLISRIYTELGIGHQTNFYFKNNPIRPLKKPTDELPIIYNFLGSLDEEESLVLTHNDFFDYLASIIKGSSMDNQLKAELTQAKNYLILGFPFDKWYLQLLLRVLSLHSSTSKFERYASDDGLDAAMKALYRDQFQINFITNDIPKFIEQLYDECEKRGLLREEGSKQAKAENGQAIDLDDIIQLIAYGKTNEAFEQLRAFLSEFSSIDKSLFNELVLLSGRFEILNQKKLIGTLYTQEDQVETAKITYSLLELINKAKELLLTEA